MNADKHYLTRLDVALLFDVSPHTVYRWTREGRLPYLLTPGGRRRYPRLEIEQIAQSWMQVHAIPDRPVRRAG